jgi:hypothetical protein
VILKGTASWVLALTLALPAVGHGAAKTVREPAFGLPHMYGDTDLELARENGRQVARDRLGQMILVARVARGTLYQVFGLLNPATLNDDIEARQTNYTSSELNDMFDKLPQADRDLILEYCEGVNDTIEQIYDGALPEPIEVTVVRGFGLSADLFGNATNLSDQVDPHYLAPGGADPDRPLAGFQFTPELAVSIAILQVRNFGLGGFNEASLLSQLQELTDVHGPATGAAIWDDLNFLNDPLAPASVPDPTTPGFGGPLALKSTRSTMVAGLSASFPRHDYAQSMEDLRRRERERAEFASRLGAWPTIGSYAWMIAGGKTESGWPWIGGFPQTGIQTPSIMHFTENVSAEGAGNRIDAVGMEFVGAPFILIGHTDSVAYTTTTAQLRIVDTFLERLVNETTDAVRYSDEGTPAPLSMRTEVFQGIGTPTRVFWRSHARGGNNGSRAVVDFQGDRTGNVTGATATTMVASSGFDAGYAGGHVLINGGPGAGQMREILSATATTLTLTAAWTTLPTTASTYVAVRPGNDAIAIAVDSPVWLEETTAVLGFAQYQRAESILDLRAGVRLIPSTHNFYAADNNAFNGIGTSSGLGGNIGYWSSGFSRKRQGGLDPRLPMDGSLPSPLVVYSGTVASATATSITATSSVFGVDDLSPPAFNFRYLNPTQQGSEFVVAITTGTGAKQSRRIGGNTGDTLTLESALGVVPDPGDTFEVWEIVGMPEAVNPAEGYSANWNNKAATADEGDNFGRQFRHIFLLERLAAENQWDREKQRQLNKDVAGLEGKGDFGRFLIPRLRQAVNAVGNGGNPDVDTVLAALEAHQAPPFLGRFFIDPVLDTTSRGEVPFLNSLVNTLAVDIFGDEFSGAVSVPTGGRALNIVQHAIDSAAADVPGSYAQAYGGDYFNGGGWETVVRDSLSALSGSIPADSARSINNYRHPLRDAFVALGNPESAAALQFEPTLAGNRGTYQQIIEVGPTLKGEFIFPLGQVGLITGSLGGVTSVDPNFATLHPMWRDWRFAPMLRVSADLAGGGTGDTDGDGVLDGWERWYFDSLDRNANNEADKDKGKLIDEFLRGSDPTVVDTDGDGIPDGRDPLPQDRLRSGFLKLRAKVRFGPTPGNDILTFVAKLGAGATEFDPTTRDITVTLSDDDQIFTITLPAGTLLPNPTGKRFVYVDPTGSLGGVKRAVFAKSKPGGRATLRIVTVKMDLSNADQFPHDVDTSVEFGAHSIDDTRLFNFTGKVLKST